MVDATISVVDRGHFECDLNYLIEGNTLATRHDRNPDVEFEANKVYNLVIDHPEGTILWDTGIHHDAAGDGWPDDLYDAYYAPEASDHRLDDDLERAGYSIDDIDYVVMSHLHSDHTGGLPFFEGTDVPIFAHAEEIKHAFASAKTPVGGAGYLASDFDRDLNWKPVYGTETQFFEDVTFRHFPGHTPGLMGVIVHLDDSGTVVFAGDEVYRETNYRDETPLGAGLLWSKPDWFQSLNELKDIERRHDAEIVFGHDPNQFAEIEDGWG